MAPTTALTPGSALRESQLERLFRERVKALGGMTVKMQAVTAGTPDRLVLLPGGTVCLVELKTETGLVSPVQQHWHARAADLGTIVEVLVGADAIRQWKGPTPCPNCATTSGKPSPG